MKYTTKSGMELPPEVVEVIEQEQARQGSIYTKDDWGIRWQELRNAGRGIYNAFYEIWYHDDFTEFYKLYPKKDLDSYGNEIVKGEMVKYSDTEAGLDTDKNKGEFFAISEKSKNKYIVYSYDYTNCISWKFCRKITEKPSLKSELQTQMNDLLKQAKEIEAKINELTK